MLQRNLTVSTKNPNIITFDISVLDEKIFVKVKFSKLYKNQYWVETGRGTILSGFFNGNQVINAPKLTVIYDYKMFHKCLKYVSLY